MTMESTDAEFAASIRQAQRHAVLFFTIAAIVLISGTLLVGDVGRSGAIAGLTIVAWTAVQAIGIAYLRTSPKHPAIGLAVVGGAATVFAILGLTAFTNGWTEAVVVAGTWLACGASTEFVRGLQWRRAITRPGTSGDIVRTLAVHAGYDGTPLLSFLAGAVLVGLWALLLDVLAWVAPFAVLVHIATGLGLSANSGEQDDVGSRPG